MAAELGAAGFDAVIEKPVSLAQLGAMLARYAGAANEPAAPAEGDASPLSGTDLLDDRAALLAIGSDAEALYALRRLFAAELNELETQWSADAAAVEQERLHRLRASCGFCGAPALGEAARRLELALRERRADTAPPLAQFLDLCRRTRAALDAAPAPQA